MASRCQNFETNRNSFTGGIIIITVPTPAADVQYASSQPCRSCLVQQKAGTQAYMNYKTAVVPSTMATTTDWILSKTTPIAAPIDDVQDLHFCGTAGDLIQIFWRG